jgi:alpha-beta hydrolase superfamily lysophospholipase
MRVIMQYKMLFVALSAIGAIATCYFALGAWIIHFELDRFLFPNIAVAEKTREDAFFRVGTINSDSDIVVRRYGKAEKGCVIFFPGQHAGVLDYERYLFPKLEIAGMEVFSISYPGQEGSIGSTDISELQKLIGKVIVYVDKTCSMNRTVFVGRSLGSMLAVYSVPAGRPAGVVIEGVAPSLSSAMQVFLSKTWYLQPLRLLPVKALLQYDYSLAEAFTKMRDVPVAIFQGAEDKTTPIECLKSETSFPSNVRLRLIEGGTHSNTYRIAIDEYVNTVVEMATKGTYAK